MSVASSLLDGVEVRADLGRQRRVLGAQRRGEQAERRLRAVDVGLEVAQIGVRVAILFAADLRGGDLVEQSVGAVGELVRLVGQDLGLLLERLHVREELIRDGTHSLGGILVPQRLFDAVETRPLLALRDVVDAGVDVRIEVAEALGHRLDRLVGDARGGELRLGLLDVAGLHGGHERLDLRDEVLGLRRHVALIAGGRPGQERVVGGGRAGGAADRDDARRRGRPARARQRVLARAAGPA